MVERFAKGTDDSHIMLCYLWFDSKGGRPRGKCRFQLELSSQLIASNLEQATKEAGGDWSKVRCAAQPGRVSSLCLLARE